MTHNTQQWIYPLLLCVFATRFSASRIRMTPLPVCYSSTCIQHNTHCTTHNTPLQLVFSVQILFAQNQQKKFARATSTINSDGNDDDNKMRGMNYSLCSLLVLVPSSGRVVACVRQRAMCFEIASFSSRMWCARSFVVYSCFYAAFRDTMKLLELCAMQSHRGTYCFGKCAFFRRIIAHGKHQQRQRQPTKEMRDYHRNY